MAVDYRARSLGTALRYKGREGMWTWILHRVTGLGVLLFLLAHVVDTGLIIWSPEFYDHALALYRHPLFRVGELFIFFAVLFHALNGLRIIVQDFWPYLMHRQRQLAWGAVAVALVAMVPITWMMMAPVFGLADEPGVGRHHARCQEAPTAPACLQEGSPESEEVAL